MQTKVGGYLVDRKVKQLMKKAILIKKLSFQRPDPYLQGTRRQKEKVSRSRRTAILNLNFPVLAGASGL